MAIHEQTKILIVDDEPDIASTLQEYIEEEGYVTVRTSDGATALDMIVNENDYALVLLDISMPGLDGITVLKSLQAAGSHTAVIMMTGYGNTELAVECMQNGAEDYISKPFGFDDMIQRVKRALAHRQDRIEKLRLQQEREDFILMLSHDMKNPLTAVMGSIDIIREGCLGSVNEEQGEYLQSAIDSCNEVIVMIDNLLDIRKFEAGKMQMSIQPHNIGNLIQKVADQFARPARHEGIELTANIPSGAAEVMIDRNAFTRVLGNLLGNALKFTPDGGAISLVCQCLPAAAIETLQIPPYAALPANTTQPSHYYKVVISDTGNGIPHEELELIFDRFTQFSRKTGRELGGAGLGLAYCKLVIDKLAGMIWASSESGQGSSFTILLPCSCNSITGNQGSSV